jgi:hypothetical protein
MLKRLLVPVIVLALAAAACSSQPESCDEVADETIVLMQDLIDEVESELGEMTVQELIESFGAGEEIPSVAAFEEKADQLSERAGELDCTQEELEAAVAQRTDRLTATTPLGQFIIQAIEGGGL